MKYAVTLHKYITFCLLSGSSMSHCFFSNITKTPLRSCVLKEADGSVQTAEGDNAVNTAEWP